MKKNSIKRVILLTGVVGVVSLGALYFSLAPYTDRIVTIEGKTFFFQERTSPAQWQKGLSGREDICTRCGMLFLFPEARQSSFWMKDMLFDIDIVWLNGKKIVHIEENVSHETPEKTYRPKQKATAVLELKNGQIEQLGLREGVYIEL